MLTLERRESEGQAWRKQFIFHLSFFIFHLLFLILLGISERRSNDK
jgi:hypothetical protein